MALRERLNAKVGRAFTKVSKKFFEPGTEIEFLQINDATGNFNIVDSKAANWWLEYDSFRKQFLLQVVDIEVVMKQTMETATHFRLDEDVYVIAAGDVTEPKASDVTWKIYCEKFVARSQFRPLY